MEKNNYEDFISFLIKKSDIVFATPTKDGEGYNFMIEIPKGEFKGYKLWQGNKFIKKLENNSFKLSFLKNSTINIFKNEKGSDDKYITSDQQEIDINELLECFEVFIYKSENALNNALEFLD
jgi:hypothetical protein